MAHLRGCYNCAISDPSNVYWQPFNRARGKTLCLKRTWISCHWCANSEGSGKTVLICLELSMLTGHVISTLFTRASSSTGLHSPFKLSCIEHLSCQTWSDFGIMNITICPMETICNQGVWWWPCNYPKSPKNSDTRKICCNCPEIWKRRFYRNATKRCRWKCKQGRPWSDCSSRSSLIWVCTVCPDLPVQ